MTEKVKHPGGLYVLFFTEMWERFSYYGMRALLVLYMVNQMKYADTDAYGIYAAYGALVYASPFFGGMIADRILGYKKSIIWGGILMAFGHFMMAFENPMSFYTALALLCVGNGFFKPNISSLVGQLYDDGDSRRDAGFTIFYMGINLGAMFSPLLCGYIGETYGWHYGFSLAGIGMLAGLTQFSMGQKHLDGKGLPPSEEALKGKCLGPLSRQHAVYLGTLFAIPTFAYLIINNAKVGTILVILGIAILGWTFFEAFKRDVASRDRLLVLVLLMFFHTVFWAFFEQAGSSLTLFADRNVDRMIFGWHMPASMTQVFNPFFIITLGSAFVWLWSFLERKGLQPSVPMKFSLAILQVGLGFGALVMGAKLAGEDSLAALPFLVLAYLLHTTGELCISPIGLSAVTKLAPKEIVGAMMGTWFLSISFSHYAAGAIAKLTQVSQSVTGEAVSAAETLVVYSDVFEKILFASTGLAVLAFVLVPFSKKMMHGVE
ncbi:MAG: MFS transporter [Bdellovibrionaceae bacterium]|nr:MFS transporter [Pseudobdellovibrionaceae bacterium]|tara:strand:- start:7160 stop:8629 length:1470 start_codon:yes stop_codon:yes gene_type:complete